MGPIRSTGQVTVSGAVAAVSRRAGPRIPTLLSCRASRSLQPMMIALRLIASNAEEVRLAHFDLIPWYMARVASLEAASLP